MAFARRSGRPEQSPVGNNILSMQYSELSRANDNAPAQPRAGMGDVRMAEKIPIRFSLADCLVDWQIHHHNQQREGITILPKQPKPNLK
jgi:hypothetical protein